MAAPFTFNDLKVSDPRDGVRSFSAKLTATDFNTSPVVDNAETTDANTLLERLRQLGANVLIREINIRYVGDASGVVLKPQLYNADGSLSSLEVKQTAYATDHVSWAPLHRLIRMSPEIHHYLFTVEVIGYAATDDMVLDIHGEVW